MAEFRNAVVVRVLARLVAVAGVGLALTASSCQPMPSPHPATTTTTPSTTTTTTNTDPSTGTVVVGGKRIEVSVPPGLAVTVGAEAPASVPPAPAHVAFPYGALGISVQQVPVGSIARVTIVLPERVDGLMKLIDGHWSAFPHEGVDGPTGATVSADGRTVTLDLQDGGRGDSDGVANGTIIDPASPTTFVGEQCFVSKLDSPTSPDVLEWDGSLDGSVGFREYIDHDCTTLRDGQVPFAAILSTPPPLPAGYSNWAEVPLSLYDPTKGGDPTPLVSGPEHDQAVAACDDLFGVDASSGLVTQVFFVPVTITAIADTPPPDLWGCALHDPSTFATVYPAP